MKIRTNGYRLKQTLVNKNRELKTEKVYIVNQITAKKMAMVRLTICFLFICITAGSKAQSTGKEKVVRAYYSAFEKKDWNALTAQLADGFTFTSPNNDDHISVDQFKEKCWGTAKFIKKVDYIKMLEKGDDLMLMVQISTVDDKVIRNVDVFGFSSTGKIKSIEVFFGAGSKYPGNKEQK